MPPSEKQPTNLLVPYSWNDGHLVTVVDQIGDEEMVLDYAMAAEKLRQDTLNKLLRASTDLHKQLASYQQSRQTTDFNLTQSQMVRQLSEE